MALPSHLGLWIGVLVQPHPPEVTLGLFPNLSNCVPARLISAELPRDIF
jgi:hypothetical protein